MKIPLKVKSLEQFLDYYLSLISTLISTRLTNIELTVLKEFILLPPKYQYAPFSSPAKRKVLSSLKEKGIDFSLSNLNNRIYSLIDKGFIRRDEDSVLYLSSHIIKVINSFKSKNSLEINITFVDESRQD